MSGLEITVVADDEELYRSIYDDRRLFQCDKDGKLMLLSASAFNDRGGKPSVDRASKRNNPEESKKGPEQAIVSLVASSVRTITVAQRDAKDRIIQQHAVDVIHDPKVENESHSLICPAPDITAPNTFRRLKESLALQAAARGWTIPPQSMLHPQ